MTPEKDTADKQPEPAEKADNQEVTVFDRPANDNHRPTVVDGPANDNSEINQPANDNGEVAGKSSEYAALLNSKQGKDALEKVKQWAANPESVKGIGKAFSYFDTCLPMRKFRDWWDRRDRLTQWAIMYGTTPPPLLMQNSGVVQTLIKFGFITYKGHVNEDPKKMEDEIDRMGGMSEYLLKYGVKVGKYFLPELAALEPFVEPIMQVKGIQKKGLRNLRSSVRYYREKYENEQLTPADVTADTQVAVDDTLQHVPSEDNAPVIYLADHQTPSIKSAAPKEKPSAASGSHAKAA